jgi:hypothetical protein
MGYCVTWVEGEDLAIELMQKRERTNERPYRCECIMRLGESAAELNYIDDPNGRYHEMWMLYFPTREERLMNYTDITKARLEGYELMRLGKLSYRTRRD